MKQLVCSTLAMASMILLFAPVATAQTAPDNLPRVGIIQGAIVDTESDVDGLFSIMVRVQGRMHQFTVRDAELKGGSKSDLQKNAHVRIKFKNREHSEMDDFFTATAVTLTILKHGDKRELQWLSLLIRIWGETCHAASCCL